MVSVLILFLLRMEWPWGSMRIMINGEGWLANKAQCKLHIVKVKNYMHDTPNVLPVAPSPNLNTPQSILLYPTLCLFEGTIVSQGRGTHFPFTVLGNPDPKEKYAYSFTPTGIKGMAETPLHQNQARYGLDLREYDAVNLRKSRQINLGWLIEMYRAYPFKEQIIAGKTEDEIRQSWEPGLSQFKQTREKYLLYP